MANILLVSAFKIGNPVGSIIYVKRDNLAWNPGLFYLRGLHSSTLHPVFVESFSTLWSRGCQSQPKLPQGSNGGWRVDTDLIKHPRGIVVSV
jgi:hypothetical protein